MWTEQRLKDRIITLGVPGKLTPGAPSCETVDEVVALTAPNGSLLTTARECP